MSVSYEILNYCIEEIGLSNIDMSTDEYDIIALHPDFTWNTYYCRDWNNLYSYYQSQSLPHDVIKHQLTHKTVNTNKINTNNYPIEYDYYGNELQWRSAIIEFDELDFTTTFDAVFNRLALTINNKTFCLIFLGQTITLDAGKFWKIDGLTVELQNFRHGLPRIPGGE